MTTVAGNCAKHNMLVTVSTTCGSDPQYDYNVPTAAGSLASPPPPLRTDCRQAPAVTPHNVRIAWHQSILPLCQVDAGCNQALVFNASNRQSVTEVASQSCTSRVLQTWASEADGPTLTRVMLTNPGMRYFMSTVPGHCSANNMLLTVSTTCASIPPPPAPGWTGCRLNPLVQSGIAHVPWRESLTPICDVYAACGTQLVFTSTLMQDVIEVSAHSCSASVLQTWADAQVVTVQLASAGVRYFMSSVAGHCSLHNMLLTVWTAC